VNNVIATNQYNGIDVSGLKCENTIIEGNIFDGNSYKSYGNEDFASIVLDNCHDITVKGNVINNTGSSKYQNHYGIYLSESNNNFITGNILANNTMVYSMMIEQSSSNQISGNVFTNNGHGILLSSGNENKINGNILNENIVTGIQINGGSHHIIGNNIQKGREGIYVSSNDNIIKGNFIDGCTDNGVYLTWVEQNLIYENSISNNDKGIIVWSSHSNNIYHNNFINNNINAYAERANPQDNCDNNWDSEEKGNYWSDYTGVDLDGDLIGDTPYDIPGEGENQDNYPLMVTYPFDEDEEDDEDGVPPNVEITKPEKALYITNLNIRRFLFSARNPLIIGTIKIEVNATDNESGINRVEFYINGGLRETVTDPPYTYNWTKDPLLPRLLCIGHIHCIKVVAFDNSENENSTSIKVRRYF
jgi:parallel beta-helix repeat protein